MPLPKKNSRRNRSGFSLVEFVIYIALFVVSTTFLVSILTTIGRIQVRQAAVTEVNQETNFINQTIRQLIRESSLVDIPIGVPTSTLVLRNASSTFYPTLVYASGTEIYLKDGPAAPFRISGDSVAADSFTVTRFEGGGKSLVQVDLVIRQNVSSGASLFRRAVQSVVTRVTAATFDSDLIPGTDGAFNLGVPTASWRNGYFSGNVGIGTTVPSAKLDVNGVINADGISALVTFNDGRGIGLNGTELWFDRGGSYFTGFNLAVSPTQGLYVKGNGNIGIGKTGPNYKLELANCSGPCAGKPDGVSWTDTSDARLKKVLGFYPRGLKEILTINPVIFQYKEGNPLNLPWGIKRTGLIAQEVQKAIPEAVFTAEDGYLRLNPDPVFWAMLNAIKDHEKEIGNLRVRLENVEQKSEN